MMALVFELRHNRPDDLANRVTGSTKLARNLLDRLALRENSYRIRAIASTTNIPNILPSKSRKDHHHWK